MSEIKTESRTKKSFLNARINFIFYFLSIIINFFSRKIFLDTLGADFVGLTTTLQNLLGFLNLAELGVGTAIGYVLYKPLFDHNRLKINEVISVMGYLYRIIGCIILVAGIIMSCFLPWIFPDDTTGFDLALIYFAFYSFLTSSLIGYFINYRQNLLSADQRNYVVTAYFQTSIIIKTLIQLASAWYTGSYYLWVAIELTFGIIHSFILNWKINQTYPWLAANVKLGHKVFKKYPEVMKYTKQLFMHRLGMIVKFQAAPLLIYAYVSLQIVAFYGNYTMLTGKIGSLFQIFLSSTSAGIGNLVAEGNKEKTYRTYWELMSCRLWFVAIALYLMYVCVPPFITLWLGEEYLLPDGLLVLILIEVFIGMLRGNTDQFLEAHGLFYDVWAPLTESIIYIVSAVVAGYYWGIYGVIGGSILSLIIIIFIWKPYFLFTKGFGVPVRKYWLNIALYFVLAVIAFVIVNYFEGIVNGYFPKFDNWINLIINAAFSGVGMALLYFILTYCFTSGMRNFVSRMCCILAGKMGR